MKTVTAAFVLLLIFQICPTQQRMYRRARGRVFWGPIRSIRTEQAEFINQNGEHVEGPRALVEVITFNEDGTQSEVAIYNRYGSIINRVVETYDQGGHMLETSTFKANGQISTRTEYKLDSLKRWSEIDVFRADGSLLTRTKFTYDGNQRFEESTSYDANGLIASKTTGVLDMKTHQMQSVGQTSTGVVERRSGFTDVPNGQIYEQSTNGVPGERSVSMRQGSNGAEVTRYHPDGSVIRRSRSRSEFDDYGNATKTVWSDKKGDVFEPSLIIYRSIEYYHKAQ